MVVSHPTAPKSGDYSGFVILMSNGFAILLAFVQNWDLRPLLIIYWSQSVIIGVFNFLRMMKLKQFSTEGLTSNGVAVPETSSGKRSTAFFFAMHYGIFHAAYLFFLVGIALGGEGKKEFGGPWKPDVVDLLWIALAVAGFLVSHWISFRKNVADDLRGRPNIGKMMFLPYARVIPMHLTIIFGFWLGSNRGAVLLFMVLKTAADYIMHIVEHRALRK